MTDQGTLAATAEMVLRYWKSDSPTHQIIGDETDLLLHIIKALEDGREEGRREERERCAAIADEERRNPGDDDCLAASVWRLCSSEISRRIRSDTQPARSKTESETT